MRGRPAVVVYTLVEPELREAMRALCRRAPAPLLRPARPADRRGRARLRQAAKMTPGSRPPLNSAYFKRMEAIEFAVALRRRRRRTACTRPTSCSSASRAPRRRRSRSTSATSATRPRTSRVVKGIEPPAELFEIDQAKIVGLTIDPNRLAEIRRARVRTMGARNRQLRRARPRSTRSSSRPRSSTGGSAAR